MFSWLNAHKIILIVNSSSEENLKGNLLIGNLQLSEDDVKTIDQGLTPDQLTGWKKFSFNKDGSPSTMSVLAQNFWDGLK